MWILQSSEGEMAPLIFRVSAGSIKTVGRGAIADLVLDVSLVSRIHCRLEAHHETLEVVDLESTNGVFVNGERVTRAHLIPGDTLRVGRVELAVGRTE
jgi:ABC transport system ATP-binding/permease protein